MRAHKFGRIINAASVHGLVGSPFKSACMAGQTPRTWPHQRRRAEDIVLPVEHGQRMAPAIPGARPIVYDGVGHVAQEEAPLATIAEDFPR